MKAFITVVFVFVSVCGAAESQPKCKDNPKVVGACHVVHGRLSVWIGTPAIRIWPIGSKRLLGVTAGPRADDAEDPIYPAKVKKLIHGYGEQVFGDYEVCPFTEEKPGEMQLVCVNSASKLRVKGSTANDRSVR